MTKLRCEGIFTHSEYDVATDQPPYYIIYKRSSGGLYESSEHFNGLTALIKGRRENYGDRKAKVMSDFLHKVYRHGSYRRREGGTKEKRHIAELMKNANPLYVSSDALEKIYHGCYFPPRHSFEKRGGGLLKVEKHCLSHNYVLLEWDDESRLLEGRFPHEGKSVNYKMKNNGEEREEDASHKGEKDIWGFISISRVDLLEHHFEDHLRELYHVRLRMKDKRLAVLLSFFFHHGVVRNLRVNSMIAVHMEEKRVVHNLGESDMQKNNLKKGRGVTKEVFTVAFEMHARNNKCVDHLSFLLKKFHCEDVTEGTFFTNSFFNNMIYVYSRKLKEEVRYENVTFVEGLNRGVFLLSYLFFQMGRVDRLLSGGISYTRVRRSYTIGVEDRVVYMPALFRDHLYLAGDYVMYWEDTNQLVRHSTVANLTVEKQFKGEGMKRSCRTTVRVVCDEEAACGGASPLRNCSAIVLDLHPNGIVMDKERLVSPYMTASFADIEGYKSVSPASVTKYRVMSLSQGRLSSGATGARANAPEQEGGEDIRTGSSHQPCAAISFDVQICSRYVAPCGREKELKRSRAKEEVARLSGEESPHPTYGDNTCTDYHAVLLSNAKVFLTCEGDAKETVSTHAHRWNATLYADATHVYFNGGEDMLSVHTRDFFLFLSEMSFVQVLSPLRGDHTQAGYQQRDHAQRGGGDKREEGLLETLATYSLARTINTQKIMNKRIIYDEVLAGVPPWQHVATANDVETLRWPPPLNGPPMEGAADYYVDLVYVHSVPHGADSYLYVLCVSVLTSVMLVLCTFVLARKFSQ
ncbi:hypothetical protein AK88_03592 [Plasmodium fragile]|uniref:Uncharacterized protein n=1 Tax=Plasmodium fragile TaxID=5857 RepID=A0A0D9QIJ9_PLAFR|nr:uncharacterized protein AK88_03592 [Plasmodium fragile]KJP86778.1 hypothetical protein AK88_03592 [Plasmodium fragile]